MKMEREGGEFVGEEWDIWVLMEVMRRNFKLWKVKERGKNI